MTIISVGILLAGLVAIICFVIGINAWMRSLNVSSGIRATIVVLLIFILPSVASIGIALVGWSHSAHQQQPATVSTNSPSPIVVYQPPVTPIVLPQQAGMFDRESMTRSTSVSTVRDVQLVRWPLLVVLTLAFVGLMIAIQVWLKQQGASVSARGLLIGTLSLLWLLPVAAVVLWVSYRAVEKSQAAYPAVEVQASQQGVPSSSPSEIKVALLPEPPPTVSVLVENPPATSSAPPSPTPPAQPTTTPASAPASPVVAAIPQQQDAPLAKSTAPLPNWVQRGYFEQKNSRFYVASSQQFASLGEAQDQALMAAVRIVETDLRAHYPGTFHNVVTPEQLKRTAIRNQHNERIERRSTTSGTPFEVQRVYYQVELSPEVYNDFRAEWTAGAVNERLRGLGAFGGFLTLLFATLAGYLRLDDRTKGAYRGRLRVAAVSLIIAAGVAAATVI